MDRLGCIKGELLGSSRWCERSFQADVRMAWE